MIWLLAMVAYAVVATVTAIPASREVSARHLFCHGENASRYSWSDSTYCNRHCRRGCWRSADSVSLSHAAQGIGLAVAWPALALPFVVRALANGTRMPRADRRTLRTEQRRIALDAAIAKAEREAGIS